MNKNSYKETLNLLCMMFNTFFDMKRSDMYIGIEYAIIQLSMVYNIDIVEDEKYHKHVKV